MQNLVPVEQKNPNPQGKGCVPVLQDWAALRPHLPGRKSPTDVIKDYCLSSLVLAAKFRFKPVPGKSYYLYSDPHDWTLSLIAPHEWGQRQPGDYVAHCLLRSDMTWQLEIDDGCLDSPVRQRLERFVEGFSAAVTDRNSLLSGLPFYASKLPYFQRMAATGLAVSLQHSVRGIDSHSLEQPPKALDLILGSDPESSAPI
ncbi:MAG: hypothetical protein ACI9DH_001621 [Halioglobus sp.]|jgi:hypothetical protein